MATVAWFQRRCRSCGAVYAETLAERPVLLGSGHRRCRKCKTVIDDGSREWPELTSSERRGYFLSNGAIVFIGSALLFGAMAAMMGDALSERVAWAGGVVAFFVSPLIPMWGWKAVRVWRSNRRYALANA